MKTKHEENGGLTPKHLLFSAAFMICLMILQLASASAGYIISQPSGGYTGFIYSNGKYTTGLTPEVTGINNSGQVVGSTLITNGGYIYDSGTYTTINPPGWKNVHAYGINNNGVVVGCGLTQSFPPWTSYIYNNGTYTTLNPLTGYSGGVIAFGINDSGVVAGTVFDAYGRATAFIYNYSAIITIKPPGQTDLFAFGINNTGELVGWNRSTNTGFMYDYNNGAYRTILPPGWTRAYAEGINNSGQAVGYAGRADEITDFIYIYTAGAYTILNAPPGWNLVYARDGSPVPLPSAIFLLGSGLFGLIGFRWKFRK
jgi:hypothetical protein